MTYVHEHFFAFLYVKLYIFNASFDIIERNGCDSVDILSDLLPLIGFYSLPFIILIFSKWINKQFKMIRLSFKVVDLIIPYMIVLIFIMSELYFPINLIPYLILIISVLGILLATYYTFYLKELKLYLFFRIWWRVVFITCLIIYIGAGVWVIFQWMN